MDRAFFEKMVGEVFENLPEVFKKKIKNVAITVKDYPSKEILSKVKVDSPCFLLGSYQGIPLSRRGVGYSNVLPDKITLYQKSIESICKNEKELRKKIREVVIHEIGHYFGLKEEELVDTEDVDVKLMKKIAQGDLSAFRPLVEKYQNTIINIIYRYIGNRSEAEELTQEVFLRVFKSAKKYKPRAKFSTWLYRITINLCLNYKRDKKKIPMVSLNTPSENNGQEIIEIIPASKNSRPDIILQNEERNIIIKRAIYSLPEKQRIAVILQEFEDLSYKEISRIMKCSVSAVESLLFRARENLRKRLTPYFR